MPKPFIGVRWWLGVAFAVVAATSTAIVVAQFSDRSENAFRRHAESLALADAKAAAQKDVTAASLDRVASKLQGNVASGCSEPLERRRRRRLSNGTP